MPPRVPGSLREAAWHLPLHPWISGIARVWVLHRAELQRLLQTSQRHLEFPLMTLPLRMPVCHAMHLAWGPRNQSCLPMCPLGRKPPFPVLRVGPPRTLSGRLPGLDALSCPFLCSLDLQVTGHGPAQRPSPPCRLGSSVRGKTAAFRPLHTDPCQHSCNGLVLQEGGRVLLLFMHSTGKKRCSLTAPWDSSWGPGVACWPSEST